jgi:hypothetical protein
MFFGLSSPPPSKEEISFASKLLASFKVLVGEKPDLYYANQFICWLPICMSSHLALRTCYRER